MKANGTVFKYGDNVDTDVIIPARYLNSSDGNELAKYCMEDIDPDFAKNVKKYVQNTMFSVVKETLTAEQLKKCQKIADECGVYLKVRTYISG